MAKANIELPMFSTDINEIKIYELDHVILDLLLADKSSKRNILWATKDYLSYGNLYDEHCQIMPEQITYDKLICKINHFIPDITKQFALYLIIRQVLFQNEHRNKQHN